MFSLSHFQAPQFRPNAIVESSHPTLFGSDLKLEKQNDDYRARFCCVGGNKLKKMFVVLVKAKKRS